MSNCPMIRRDSAVVGPCEHPSTLPQGATPLEAPGARDSIIQLVTDTGEDSGAAKGWVDEETHSARGVWARTEWVSSDWPIRPLHREVTTRGGGAGRWTPFGKDRRRRRFTHGDSATNGRGRLLQGGLTQRPTWTPY